MRVVCAALSVRNGTLPRSRGRVLASLALAPGYLVPRLRRPNPFRACSAQDPDHSAPAAPETCAAPAASLASRRARSLRRTRLNAYCLHVFAVDEVLLIHIVLTANFDESRLHIYRQCGTVSVVVAAEDVVHRTFR